MRLDVVAADNEAVLGWNPELEYLSIAHHVKRPIADDGEQADHAQHSGLARQHVATNLLVIGNLSLLHATNRSVDIDSGLHGLHSGRLCVHILDQFSLGGSFEWRLAHLSRLHFV